MSFSQETAIPSGWGAAKVQFAFFPNLRHDENNLNISEPFHVHGLAWELILLPGSMKSKIPWMSLYIGCSSTMIGTTINASYSFSLLHNNGSEVFTKSYPADKFKEKYTGFDCFLMRKEIFVARDNFLSYGKEEVLTIVVWIKVFKDCFVPLNNMNVNAKMLSLLEFVNSESYPRMEEKKQKLPAADVSFIVEGKKFRAHSFILEISSPELLNIFEDNHVDAPITIIGVRPLIFWCLLKYAYGGYVPIGNSFAMEILDAAYKFKMIELKLLAESKLVEEISIERASDLLLYADAKGCALLCEKVIEYFVLHSKEIIRSSSFQHVKKSLPLMIELMDSLGCMSQLREVSFGHADVEYHSMGVSLLRKKLENEGLEIDGSREMLIKRLHQKDNRNEMNEAVRPS